MSVAPRGVLLTVSRQGQAQSRREQDVCCGGSMHKEAAL